MGYLDIFDCKKYVLCCSATCSVLAETCKQGGALEVVLLADNPLGRTGARKLLQSVSCGDLKQADVR